MSVITEMVKQTPTLGAVLLVGYFGFSAYQRLVEKLMDVIEASTKAITAATGALEKLGEALEARDARLSDQLDSLPGKVIHEFTNPVHARLLREELERRRSRDP